MFLGNTKEASPLGPLEVSEGQHQKEGERGPAGMRCFHAAAGHPNEEAAEPLKWERIQAEPWLLFSDAHRTDCLRGSHSNEDAGAGSAVLFP